MEIWSFSYIPPGHNKNYAESCTLQAEHPDRPGVFSDNWLDVRDPHNRDIPSDDIGRLDLHPGDEEVKKDWLSEEVLIAYSQPLILFIVWAGVLPYNFFKLS
jgi:hypothetical protein